eukprot:scaffold602_cov298-Pinguiococcus_pyrenoidosus.AAC.4
MLDSGQGRPEHGRTLPGLSTLWPQTRGSRSAEARQLRNPFSNTSSAAKASTSWSRASEAANGLRARFNFSTYTSLSKLLRKSRVCSEAPGNTHHDAHFVHRSSTTLTGRTIHDSLNDTPPRQTSEPGTRTCTPTGPGRVLAGRVLAGRVLGLCCAVLGLADPCVARRGRPRSAPRTTRSCRATPGKPPRDTLGSRHRSKPGVLTSGRVLVSEGRKFKKMKPPSMRECAGARFQCSRIRLA